MKYIVDKNSSEIGNRIDKYLADQDASFTRSYVQKMLGSGNVMINGKEVKASYKVKATDVIEVNLLEDKMTDIKAEEIDVDIVYEDSDLILVNKPKNMVVHPGSGNYSGTLVNALLHSHGTNLSAINGVIRPGIVHRIDKDTTGIIVVAKNDKTHKALSELFKKHDITRKYIALVKGIVDKDKLLIDLPIGRDEKDRKKMSVTTKNSKKAITHINVLERFYKSGYTLIEAVLETGRTHQIRVHMSYIGHPLVGDDAYGKGKNEFGIKGQMLHAKVLGFIHPTTEKYIEFEEEIPTEFEDIIKKLRDNESENK